MGRLIDADKSILHLNDYALQEAPFGRNDIVDCYFLNDGETIHIYRPNPNAKEVYKPLSLKDHINFVKNNYLC